MTKQQPQPKRTATTQERLRRAREDRKAERHIDALCKRNPYM